MKLTSKIAVCAVVSAAFLLGAAAPSHAQATPIGNGQGLTGDPGPDLRTFSFSVVELPNGSVTGHGQVFDHGLNFWVHFNITSFMFIDDMLLMAGPVTKAVNAPNFTIGATFFFAVKDGGKGKSSIDEISLVSVAPPNLTIQEIISFIGPPPPEIIKPISAGNIKIH